ncbi:MAG: TonB-dependent receptor, partial [Sphingobacteriaceae bacterium]
MTATGQIRNCFFFLTIISCFLQPVWGQQKFTLNGYVKDSLSGESLTGASLNMGNTRGVSTNAYGFFSITLPKGKYLLSSSYVGYQSAQYQINLDSNLSLDIMLLPQVAAENSVTVVARRRDANVQSTEMGKVDLSIERIKQIPAFLGEIDILKTIQLLPGVRNSGEGNSGFYVRGGGPDQNLLILDDAVVYNPGHLFGFFSVFNSDAIKNVTLIKGGMPAQYGG